MFDGHRKKKNYLLVSSQTLQWKNCIQISAVIFIVLIILLASAGSACTGTIQCCCMTVGWLTTCSQCKVAIGIVRARQKNNLVRNLNPIPMTSSGHLLTSYQTAKISISTATVSVLYSMLLPFIWQQVRLIYRQWRECKVELIKPGMARSLLLYAGRRCGLVG